jgi:hypothetical protein
VAKNAFRRINVMLADGGLVAAMLPLPLDFRQTLY